VCYTPVLDPAGHLSDFAFAYLNPAAQHLLDLRACPRTTYLQHFPLALTDGAFAFHCATFLAGEPSYFDLPGLGQAPDHPYRLVGQRLGQTLLVSFTRLGEQAPVARLHQSPAQVEQVEAEHEQLQLLNEEYATANEELVEANQQLLRVNEDLDTFLYVASHDLKAPINNIEGLLLALHHELTPAVALGEVPHLLHLMQEAVERFGRTIDTLTDMVGLQRPDNQQLKQIAFAQLVHEVLLDLTPLLEQTAARVDVLVPRTLALRFSEQNLRSVVFNLVSNALKYRHADRVPLIRIQYLPTADYQTLTVEDNGLGIELHKDKERLFAMFERLHNHVEGAGIGLYLVKRMLENVGGRIEVQSELGQGTTFTVCFPR
jgi:signal transduction histidine kinase